MLELTATAVCRCKVYSVGTYPKQVSRVSSSLQRTSLFLRAAVAWLDPRPSSAKIPPLSVRAGIPMKLRLIRFGLVSMGLVGCGGATSIDLRDYPDDESGTDSLPGHGGMTSSNGGTGAGTGTATGTSVGGKGHPVTTATWTSGGSTYVTKGGGGSTWTTTTGHGASTSWSSTSTKGGATYHTTKTSKGGATGHTSVTSTGGSTSFTYSTSKGGTTSWTATTYCLYGDSIFPAGTSFTADNGCTSCYCGYDGGLSCSSGACTCEYFGESFWYGDVIAAKDGCNTCTCQWGGGLSCSTTACPSACTYGGRIYADTEEFTATDGCNTCSCDSGKVVCSARSCSCSVEQEYWRQYIAFSSDACALLTYRCQPGAVAFANDCGCGCEQSPDCPAQFVCGSDFEGIGGASSGTWPGYGGSTGTGGGSGSTYYPRQCPPEPERKACPLSGIEYWL